MVLWLAACGGNQPATSDAPSRVVDGQLVDMAMQVADTMPMLDAPWCMVPSNASPTFTADVTDLSRIDVIEPLGAPFSGDIRGHTYLVMDSATAVGVYAPTEMWLEQILYLQRFDGGYDWGMIFRVSCEVTMVFGHITDPIPSIQATWSGPATTDSRMTQNVVPPLHVNAGERLADTTGTTAHIWDFGVYNTTVMNTFANPSRWGPITQPDGGFSKYFNAVCPYAPYDPTKRAAYEAKYGSIQSRQVVANATCGSAARDVVGTVAGAWFLDPNTTPDADYRGSIGIVADAAGYTVVGGIANDFVAKDGTVPEAVTTEHCWFDGASSLYVQLASATELHVAYAAGACPGAFPANGFRVYVR